MPCKKCRLNSKKRYFKNPKNWLFYDHCFSRLVHCISMKLGKSLSGPCLIFCLDLPEYSWRYCNPNFEKRKNTKNWLLIPPISKQEPLSDLFLVFCTTFHSLNFPEVRHLANFSISLITGWTVYTEKYKPEVLTYRPTAGRSIRRTDGFIFSVYTGQPVIKEFIS